LDDVNIIDLFWDRDQEAIRQTHLSYGRKLYVLSNRILRNREDAEESVSDTYMQTWKSIPPQRPRYFYAFLAAICRNLSLDRLDWKQADKRNAELVVLTEEMEQCIPDRHQDSAMERQELRRILQGFLESLPQENRIIFLRRYLYVDTVAEIAARYGISESKVKTQLHRSRNKLRAALAKEGITV
jgi:RNA polymerase sigma-70 factor (ECF subfamily)